MSQQISPCL